MLPNAFAKLRNSDGALGFFKLAGFKHPKLFVNFTIVFEIVIGIALAVGAWVPYTAGLTAIFMFVAALVDFKVHRTWLWTVAGCEYPFFWGICSLVVALNA